jgi:hypothetical protein
MGTGEVISKTKNIKIEQIRVTDTSLSTKTIVNAGALLANSCRL